MLLASVMNPAEKPIVFVVDDEPLLIELAAAFLIPAGYVVKTFQDPDSAFQAFKESDPRPHLIITDYAMHRMTGMDLIRECRKIDPGQRIILVSGTVDEHVFQNSKVKPDRFLSKPYEARQLIGTVESVLNS